MQASFLLVRALPPGPGPRGWELAGAEGASQRYHCWVGTPPPARPAHPGLSTIVGWGTHRGEPVWLEERVAGPLLTELQVGLPRAVQAQVVAQVGGALTVLRGAGSFPAGPFHQRIVIEASTGLPMLFGPMVPAGPQSASSAGLRELWRFLGRGGPIEDPPLLGELSALISWMEGVALEGAGLALLDLVKPDVADPPEGAPRWTLELEEGVRATLTRSVDEVDVDLGPDEAEAGLLDSWTSTGRAGDTTGEPTGALPVMDTARPDLMATLARLAADGGGLGAALEQLAAAPQRPSARVKAFIADEALDPLPAPDGAPRRDPVWAGLQEPSVEITAVRPGLIPVVTQTDGTAPLPEITDLGSEATEHTRPLLEAALVPGARLIAVGVALGLGIALALLWALTEVI